MAFFTVVGGNGFIGTEIVNQLNDLGHTVFVPTKGDGSLFTRDLGILIYCAGHGDCNNNPLKVVDSNITLMADLISNSIFDKFIYLSSTRVYMGQNKATEISDLTVLNSDDRRLFNLTKLVAEELLIKSGKSYLIIRPSNVYGLALKSSLFLPSITRDAINNGEVNMYVKPEYTKDYISVNDVADLTIKLSLFDNDTNHIYNIGSGVNISAKEIADVLREETGCIINWHRSNVDDYFPITDITRLAKIIDFNQNLILDDLRIMVSKFKIEIKNKK